MRKIDIHRADLIIGLLIVLFIIASSIGSFSPFEWLEKFIYGAEMRFSLPQSIGDNKIAIVNIDDPWGGRMAQACTIPVWTYIRILKIQFSQRNTILPNIHIDLGALNRVFLLFLFIFQIRLSNFQIDASLFELVEKIIYLHLSHQITSFDEISIFNRHSGHKSRIAEKKLVLARWNHCTRYLLFGYDRSALDRKDCFLILFFI